MHDLGSFFSFLQELVVQELLDASDFVPQGRSDNTGFAFFCMWYETGL
jgi:hypothetical protein